MNAIRQNPSQFNTNLLTIHSEIGQRSGNLPGHVKVIDSRKRLQSDQSNLENYCHEFMQVELSSISSLPRGSSSKAEDANAVLDRFPIRRAMWYCSSVVGLLSNFLIPVTPQTVITVAANRSVVNLLSYRTHHRGNGTCYLPWRD